MKPVLRIIPLLWALVRVGPVFAAESPAKPVLLYSRHFNAAGETRYLPDGNYKEVLERMRRQFEVRVHSRALTPEILAQVNVILMANPSDKGVGTNPPPPHVTARDIATLTAFVRRGGGLLIMGNQENHNLETTDLNLLLAHFGMSFTNDYTDAKAFEFPRQHPVLGGLRWGFYTGNHLLLDTAHPARPEAWLVNDPATPALGGPRNPASILMAAARLDKGRVVLVTDAGWITDTALNGKGIGTVAIRDQDNFEIFRRTVSWCAGLARN